MSEKTRVVIHCLEEHEPVSYIIDAFKSETEGLVVHQEKRKTWRITHVSSGRLVRDASFLTKKDALACAEALGDVGIEWTKTDTKIYEHLGSITPESRRGIVESIKNKFDECGCVWDKDLT